MSDDYQVADNSLDGNLEELDVLNGKIERLPKTDKTLTQAGMCADAKKTGEELNLRMKYTDIVDNLITDDATKPLSAKQGVELKQRMYGVSPNYASNVEYDNTDSGLSATYVQGAIDELKEVTALSNVDLNNVTKVGFYCFDQGTGVTNSPVDSPSLLYVHPFYNSDYVNQEITLINGKGTKIRRVCHNAEWGAWEYENPLMAENIEYRTTERINGAPVYTQLIKINSWAAGSSYTYENIPHTVYRYSGKIGAFTLPYINSTLDNEYSAWANFSNNNGNLKINMCGGTGVDGNSGYIQVWYTYE